LNEYTEKGFRVIALGVQKFDEINSDDIQNMTRAEAEANLHFLGLLVMENKLKPITSDIIKELNSCKIRTIMATGDNILTAISVAR
jgi:cation-transporting ATPase 13A3/4/5